MANKLYTWGDNTTGILGTGNNTNYYVPQLISGGWDKIETGSGGGSSFAGLKDGKLYGWGYNVWGELGTLPSSGFPASPYENFTPQRIGTFSDCSDIAMGAGHTLIIRDGKLYSSGYNRYGQLGNGEYWIDDPPDQDKFGFKRIGNDSDWEKVFCSTLSSYAIKTNGDLYVWGLNQNYQLGIPREFPEGTGPGKQAYNVNPTKINNQKWTTLSSYDTNVFAISEGKLYGWGANGSYSLGLGNDSSTQEIPIQIGTDNTWQKVYQINDAGFAIKNNGSLWYAGANGALPNITAVSGYTKSLTQENTLATNWQSISDGGTNLTFFGINNNKLYYWGEGLYSGLGSSTPAAEDPTLVDDTKSWQELQSLGYGIAASAIDDSPPVIDDVSAKFPGTNPHVGDQISGNYTGDPNGATVDHKWRRRKPPYGGWVIIPDADGPNYTPDPGDIGYEIDYGVDMENEFGSDSKTSPSLGIVRAAYSTENWRFLFHQIDGTTLGEFTNLNNFKLNIGLNKNPDMSFDTTLNSNLGQLLADSLNPDNPVVIVSAWRYDPYNTIYKLQFSGPVFSIEEKGADDNPTIGVTAVGAYYRLTKRIANNAADEGRRQSGLSPTTDDLELFVTDNTGNRIMVFNGKTGTYVRKWGSTGSGNGQFNSPYGIDVGPNNYVYVADTNNNRIQKFSATGTYITKWNTVQNSSSYLNSPIDVAVDQSSGHVWVADQGNKQVVKYDADGNYLFRVQATVNCPMDNLRGIHVDFEGNAYISDQTDLTTNPNNQGVYKITPTGQIIVETSGIITSYQKKFALDPGKQAYWVNGAGNLRKGPGKPKLTSSASTMQSSGLGQSVVVGPDRSVYFLESNGTTTSKVTRYNPANNAAKVIGSFGTGDGQTRNAKGIALSRSGARDAIEIIDEIITAGNSRDGHSWIESADTQGTAQKIFIQPGSLGGFRSIASIIEQFNQHYEWEIIPKLESSGGDLLLGEWHADAVLGTNKATDGSVIFEYGFGRLNIDEYTIKKTIEGLANKINYPVSDEIPYNVTSISSPSISDIGLFEDVITGSLVATDLRKQLTDLHLFYRTIPRLLVEIVPNRSDQSGPDNTRVPIPLLEYKPGDIIGIEVKENEQSRIPASEARIYDMTIELDAEGRETCSLQIYLDE